MPHVSRASIADQEPGVGRSPVAAVPSGRPLEDPQTQSWYDADAVTFLAAEADDAPTLNRAWPPETRSIETHVRTLVVAARESARR